MVMANQLREPVVPRFAQKVLCERGICFGLRSTSTRLLIAEMTRAQTPGAEWAPNTHNTQEADWCSLDRRRQS